LEHVRQLIAGLGSPLSDKVHSTGCNTLEDAIKKAKHEELAPTSKIGPHIVASVSSDGSDKGKNCGPASRDGHRLALSASSARLARLTRLFEKQASQRVTARPGSPS